MIINMELQTKGLKRNSIDKFYTKPNIGELCIKYIKQHIHVNNTDLIIEPSAGNGSFIPFIKQITQNHIFYDLEPEQDEIIKQDYLLCNIKNEMNKIHVVGNPPFGRQSSMAIKFIKKSCEFCDTISFILPKSFKKDSLKKTFPSNFHLIFEIDLPENAFLVNNAEYNVNTIFQIWEKKTYKREIIKKVEPRHFQFVKKTENPDISVRRVGVNAGTIDIDIDEKSIQSHYFIKFTNDKSIHDYISELSKIKYEFNNTVGPKSISKQELITEFNKFI
jgi:hypothetical protein